MDINTLHKNVCTGDKQAKDELFEVLSTRFRLFAHHKIRNRSDAEEVVQEALMTIYAEYDKVTFTTSFAAWAGKVLDNRILNYFRTKQRESWRLEPEAENLPGTMAFKVNANPDLKRKLLCCLRLICRRNLRYARILNLNYQGYQTAEICDRLKVKPETLYSALSKARSMLESCLKKGDVK
ncbi:MAG: RNA polymerase sigma factor [Candidatus Zixiibacteriota bacterium]